MAEMPVFVPQIFGASFSLAQAINTTDFVGEPTRQVTKEGVGDG